MIARKRLERLLHPTRPAKAFRQSAAFLPLLLACASYYCPAAANAQGAGPAEIIVSFDDFSYAGNTGRVDVTGLKILQGALSIEAESASTTGLGFERSEWRLEGSVRIIGEAVRITGDAAEFSARNNILQRFELQGSPATFEDLEPGSAGQASGAANRLIFDAVESEISLLGDARLAVGGNEWTGCDLIYDVDDESFSSGSTDCDRPFQIRITPSEAASGPPEP